MDEEKPRTLGSIATRIVCTLVGLLLLYALSSGPTIMVVALTRHGARTWGNIYAPIGLVAEVTHTMPAAQAYVHWWDDLGYRIRPRVEDAPAPP